MRPRAWRRAPRALAAWCAVVALAGCGDSLLWARWRAERAFWQADREVIRIFVRPQAAGPQDFRRAEAAFERIARDFPADRWVDRTEPQAREVAEISGRATLALARLAELQGRSNQAVAGFRHVAAVWAGCDRLKLDALDHLGTALEAGGDLDGAMLAWERLAREFAPYDSARGEVRRPVLRAPLQLAAAWSARGARARSDSTLAAAELGLEAASRGIRSGSATVALLDAIAEGRQARGDEAGALAAWRLTLQVPGSDSVRASRMLDVGERELAAGRPDSALGRARLAATVGGPPRLRALQLMAGGLLAIQQPDSALGVYATIVAEFEHNENATAEARFQRALILEHLDRWPQARSEFSSLCATQPIHPRALESWTRVVEHYRQHGETESARIEANHGIDAIDGLLSTQHDEEVRRRCTEARASVQLADQRVRDAAETLRGYWAAGAVSEPGARLGAEAARRAAAELHDAALARGLWQILSERSPVPEVRRQAEVALGRPAS